MRLPCRTRGLLVHIHTHDQWLAQCLCDVDEPLPRWVVAEDIAGYQFQVFGLCQLDQAFRFDDLLSNGFFKKHVAASFECGSRIGCVCIRIRGDADGIRPALSQRGGHIGILRIIRAQLLVQSGARLRRTSDDPNDFKTVEAMIGQRMGTPHVAGANT